MSAGGSSPGGIARFVPGIRTALCLCSLALGLSSGVAPAQERASNQTQLIDWSYATTFGTGVYTIGSRTVTVVRIPLSLRLLAPDDDGTWGVRLKLPVTFGIYNIPNSVNDLFNTSVATVSALPGIEFVKRITPRWSIRPTFSYGFGQDVTSGNHTTLYEVGARSLYRIPMREGEISIANALLFSGNNPADGPRQNFGVFATGLNFIFPIGDAFVGRPANTGVHFIHYLFFNQLDFFVNPETRRRINQQYEIAVTLGTYVPFSVYGFELDRVGIGIQAGEGLVAIRLVSGFIF